ncbi:MAG: MBL fold metallo-hydrolase [Pseudomonadales bacterium]|nr:MBL fold metallo-hydrolase [Pseudomonadales bacterium]
MPADISPLDAAQRAAKPATAATRAVQAHVRASLPFEDRRSFESARRGFIATLEPLTIPHARSPHPVYDLSRMGFLEGDAPDTVNPSLWRQAQLNAQYNGLFEVVPGIYQVRAFDIANMTLVQGDTGWIVIDPLTSSEASRAALDLANQHLGARPVTGVIITHSHADHFAGVLGVISAADAADGRIPVIAPEGFVKEALSENVLAGNVMNRRATYMYGNLLAPGPSAFVTTGLGAALSMGTTGFVVPNDFVRASGETRRIDGIDIEFQLTPGTEAPAEMVFYFPRFKALCMSEITSHHQHNLYTPRGAQVRDALAWSAQIQESIDRFGDRLEVHFASHHWPTWGRAAALEYLEQQRDLYKFIHDQSLRLANHGFTMDEIAEQLRLPDALGREFSNRGYYGTLNHGAKAVYVKYLGHFDGNPAHLHPHPPVAAATRYLAFMGGADAVVEKARASFAEADYRWVAEVLNHVMMADPTHADARALLADAYEQLGYQAESAPWRNFYLCGALELREGVPASSPARVHPGMADNMPLEDLFKAMAVRLNAERADGIRVSLALTLTAPDEAWLVTVNRSVLHAFPGRTDADADARLALPAYAFKRMMLGLVTATELVEQGQLALEGDPAALARFAGLFDQFERRFPIVTPRRVT